MSSKTQSLGRIKERQALTHLKQQGLRPILCNYFCRYGEIDLILKDGEHIVFVEVRLRHHQRFGSALESITESKQEKILLSAQNFVAQYPAWQKHPMRFDVYLFDNKYATTGEWIKNAISD